MDDRIKQHLQDLGSAINDSVSGSEEVNRQIQRIRDEGYDVYVVLDATIGLNRLDEASEEAPAAPPLPEVQFRINVNDLAMLRSLGIDPTRKVRAARRIEPIVQSRDE